MVFDSWKTQAWRRAIRSAFHPWTTVRFRPIADLPDVGDARGMTEAPERVPDFFLHSVRYDLGSLVVTLAVKGDPHFEVQFDPPRAFRSYAESDLWQYLETYKGESLLSTPDGGAGVFISDNAPYVQEYRKNVRPSDRETTFSCLIATPQECVEVVCFEKPTIRFL